MYLYLLMPKSLPGLTHYNSTVDLIKSIFISLSEASVMVNVTKGILVECDPAMKQVLLSMYQDFHPIGYISVSSAP